MSTPRRPVQVAITTIGQLAGIYARHAFATYLKNGTPTKTAHTAARVRDLIDIIELGATPLDHLGGPWLIDFRARLAAQPGEPMSRQTINDYAAVIKQMVRFGVCFGIVHPELIQVLAAVPPLRKGRPPAPGAKPPRESRKRRPEAPAAWVSATRPFLSRTLRGMIALQRLTAMRPAEVCAIRPCDLRPSRDSRVLIYTVTAEADKLDHLDDADHREVLLGPRAQRVLRAFWPAEETEYFFSPARAEHERHAERRARRTLPMWDSHDPDRRARRKKSRQTAAERRSSRTPGECYTPQSYGKAVKRAALQAAEHEAARGVPERSRTQVWSPYQLRHAGASTLAEAGVPLEVIQRLMGHSDLKTTMNYVHVRDRAATKAAAARG